MHQTSLLEILQLLSEERYITAEELSNQLGLGERTIRYRIKALDDLLKKNGAHVESRPRFGSRLVVENRELYQSFTESRSAKDDVIPIPDNASDRMYFLLAYLINQSGYVKMDDLCEFMFISKGTMTATLKQVEVFFAQYNIFVERKPNYGIRAYGDEMDFRRCIGNIFVKRSALKPFGEKRKEEELQRLAEIVLPYIRKYHISFAETAFENFVNHIYVAGKRFSRGKTVDLKRKDLLNLTAEEWSFAEELSKRLEEEYQIIYSEAEKVYIALHLAGKRIVGSSEKDAVNFVVRSDLDMLALKMLEVIYQEFHLELRNAFDLRMALNQHMVPFDIRMRYNIPLENPLLSEIKDKYMLGYRIASVASVVLAEHYHREVPEDEIGYFALLFELTLEQCKDTSQNKKNILLVCSSGKGSSRLLQYRYKKEFDSYLNHIYVCDLQELEGFDFTKVEYVFTTVPIEKPIPVPIQEIGLFMEEQDIRNVKKALSRRKVDFLRKYYRKECFFIDIVGTDRTAILKQICDHVISDKKLPDCFTELVLQREELGSTDYGNLIAIPHPLKTITEESFVYVAVLENPVLWNRYYVQVIFLTVIGSKEDPDIQKFYEITTEYMVCQEAIQTLIGKRSFEALMEGFENLNLPE